MPGRINLIAPILKSGWWYPQQCSSYTFTMPTNFMIFVPWDDCPAGTPLSDLGVWLTTAASGGTANLHLALYDSDINGQPGAKIGETAAIDLTSGTGTAKSGPITRANSGCVTTAGSQVVNDLSSGLVTATDVGKTVTGTGIPANTVVLSVVPGNSFTLSKNATVDGTATVTFTKPVATGRRLYRSIVLQGTAGTGPVISGENPPAATSRNVGWSAIQSGSVQCFNIGTVAGALPDPAGVVAPETVAARVLCKIG